MYQAKSKESNPQHHSGSHAASSSNKVSASNVQGVHHRRQLEGGEPYARGSGGGANRPVGGQVHTRTASTEAATAGRAMNHANNARERVPR